MTTLGKYELHEELGRGGFGTVYRATDTTLGRDVALKVLHPQYTIEPDFIQRFRNEARLVASLRSPHIVTIYELGEVNGRVFIAMEYLPGGSLKDRLEKTGPIPFDESLEIMKQVDRKSVV
jgi:serine/threonine-protein kinase